MLTHAIYETAKRVRDIGKTPAPHKNVYSCDFIFNKKLVVAIQF